MRAKTAIIILILGLSFLVYWLSNPQPRDWYKHYVYLSDAFLHRRFDVFSLPSFYHDVAEKNGQRYLPFGPMPAIVLLPLVAYWGTALNQGMISILVGALNVGLAFLLLQKLKLNKGKLVFLTLFFGFGTVHWFAAITGTTWYFAHVLAVFFLLIAVILSLDQKRPLLIGLFLGAAALSRETTILATPFFLLSLNPHSNWRQNLTDKKVLAGYLLFFLGLSPFLSFQAFYNWTRFGTPLEAGYRQAYLFYTRSGMGYSFYRLGLPPETPHFGQFDVRSIPLHLYTLLFMAPKFIPQFPFVKPSPHGMSLLLTSPLFLFAFRAKLKEKLVFASWLAIVLVSIPILLHFTQGWVQFGYRFLLDFIPFLLILTAKGLNKLNVKKWALLAYCLVVNCLGVYWGVKLGW